MQPNTIEQYLNRDIKVYDIFGQATGGRLTDIQADSISLTSGNTTIVVSLSYIGKIIIKN